MLCLHYYSNYVTLRIQEDDEEYSLDQIKEFENVQHPNWSDISGAYGQTDSRAALSESTNAPVRARSADEMSVVSRRSSAPMLFPREKWPSNGFFYTTLVN